MSTEIKNRLQHFIKEEKFLLSQLLQLQRQRKAVGSEIGKAVISEGVGAFAEELFESSRAGRFGRKLSRAFIDQTQKHQLSVQERNIESKHTTLLQSIRAFLHSISVAKTKLKEPNSFKLLEKLDRAQEFVRIKTRIQHTIKTLENIFNKPLIYNKEIQIQPTIKEAIIPPGKPFSASLRLKEILESAKGYAKIIDPYVDETTLEFLMFIPMGIPIKVLTVYTGGKEKEKRFRKACQRFRAERHLFEIRKCGRELVHDRFVLTQAQGWSIGVSLKDIGKKLSMIKEVSPKTKREVESIFKQIWTESVSLFR